MGGGGAARQTDRRQEWRQWRMGGGAAPGAAPVHRGCGADASQEQELPHSACARELEGPWSGRAAGRRLRALYTHSEDLRGLGRRPALPAHSGRGLRSRTQRCSTSCRSMLHRLWSMPGGGERGRTDALPLSAEPPPPQRSATRRNTANSGALLAPISPPHMCTRLLWPCPLVCSAKHPDAGQLFAAPAATGKAGWLPAAWRHAAPVHSLSFTKVNGLCVAHTGAYATSASGAEFHSNVS